MARKRAAGNRKGKPAPRPATGAYRPPPFPVVGIGASAGGLEAVRTLLEALPADTGMCFVFIQHLDPRHVSALTEILAKSTHMPVSEIRSDVAVRPNSIYIIAPATNLIIEHGRLRLSPRETSRTPPRPIDGFFKSLAEDSQNRAIGVILSGTGSDGTLGLKAIKEAGGITFAQDASATHHGMPDSAIAEECVDFVRSPEGIAAELVRIAGHPALNPTHEAPAAPPPTGEVETAFGSILAMLSSATGIDFTQYKHPTLRRRIDRRMVLRRMDSLAAYRDCLRSDPRELEALYHETLIQVTSFFRDPEVFETLKSTILPGIIQSRSPETTLRMWVPGCSTGEEVYSMAICVLEVLKDRGVAPPVKIFATDVSDQAIEKARTAIYPESIAAEVSPERLRLYFTKTERGYQILKSVRDMCIFARQNVIRDPPFSQLDLISCRNLLIYLGSGLQNRVIPVFHYALKPGGILLLGSAESIGPFSELFEPIDKKHRFYRRTSAASHLAFDYDSGRGVEQPVAVLEARGDAHLKTQDIHREADRVVLAKYAPAGVVVDDALTVLQFRGHTGACLEPAPGAPTSNLLQLAREGLLPELRAAIEEARLSGLPARRENVRVRTNSHFQAFHVEVIPLTVPSSPQRCLVVLFEDSAGGVGLPPAPPPVSARRKRAGGEVDGEKVEGNVEHQTREVSRLAHELAATKSYLQSVIEAKEAGNEELKAANEEIISSNEELQSTNEELETAKEELQATNEELATVNDELHDRIRVATQINDDLTNLIDSANIPIVMLGQDLKLRRFSPSAQKVLNLRATDIGRHISDFKPKISIPDLVPLIHGVLDKLVVDEREVTDEDNRWYTMSIRPYRTADNKIEGATVSLFDIDALKRKEQEIVAARDFARNILEALRGALVVLDERLRVRFANPAFYELFQVRPEETENKLIYGIGSGQWNIPQLRWLLQDLVQVSKTLRDYRVEADFPGIGHKAMMLNAQQVRQPEGDGQLSMILLSIEDVTERERVERAARQTEARMKAVVEAAADTILTVDEHAVIESFNRAGETMFGYPAGDVIGRSLEVLLPPPLGNEIVDELQRHLRAERKAPLTINRSVVGRRRDGSTFPADLAISEVVTADSPLFMGVLRDMSERRALERQILDISAYEQRRIGQDLHDSAGQILTGLNYMAHGLADELRKQGSQQVEAAERIAAVPRTARFRSCPTVPRSGWPA